MHAGLAGVSVPIFLDFRSGFFSFFHLTRYPVLLFLFSLGDNAIPGCCCPLCPWPYACLCVCVCTRCVCGWYGRLNWAAPFKIAAVFSTIIGFWPCWWDGYSLFPREIFGYAQSIQSRRRETGTHIYRIQIHNTNIFMYEITVYAVCIRMHGLRE